MLTQLRSLYINCQAQIVKTFALENIVLLYFRVYIDRRSKLIRLTIFHCKRIGTQSIIFTELFKIVE